ncbi:MAG: hypothetical protein WC729_16875 [Sphingomonas sp.]|jgi:hypothetical protein|uniref:hypothetical protein n=1 Tax=Sphingomonas sp. TaxID=28214 RepID=UPI003564963A
MIERRGLLGLVLTAPAIAAFPRLAAAHRPDVSKVKTRPSGLIEVVYKAPHGKPNGLDLTGEGLWVMDQGPDNYISLIVPETGKLIREFKPASNVRASSGICVDSDDGTMWIGSTYNRLIVHLDPKTTKTIAAFQTPGAGLHYSMVGDPPGRRSLLKEAYPEAPKVAAQPVTQPSRIADGRVPLDWAEAPPGTGSHCILQKGELLFITVPNARTVFTVDKNKWLVRDFYITPGNRPHDMTWADAGKTHVWASDSNLNAFFLTDISSGEISETIQLPGDSPVIHGAKLYKGWMYCCDDTGWIFRFRM